MPLPQQDDPFAAYQKPPVDDPFAAYQQPPAATQSPEQQFASAQKESQTRTAANTPTLDQKFRSTVGEIGKNIWNAGVGTAKTAADVFLAGSGLDPNAARRLYEGAVQPQVSQFPKAYEAATGTGQFKGAPPVSRIAGTVGYGLAGVTPGVGPLAARGGEKGGRGDIPGAVADIGTAAAMGVAPEYIGDAASAVAGKVRQFATPNPDTTLYQAIPFRHEMPDYYEMSPIVRGDIKRAAQQSQGAPPSTTGVGGGWQPNTPQAPAQLTGEAPLNDIPSVLKATQAAKAENRGVMDLHVDPYRQSGWTGSGAPIADGIIDSIPATLRARAQAGIPEAVAEVQRIIQEANVYRRPFTPDEIFGLSREFNAGLNNFFNKTADAQHALIGKGGDTATLQAAAAGTRNLIRRSFGDDVAELQRRWGYLDDVESGLRAKWKQVTKSPEETPSSDLDAALLKTGIPGKIGTGDIPGAKALLRGGKTNSLLQDTFSNTEPGWPLPTPPLGGMPGVGGIPRTAPPSRQLPPAPPQIGRNYVPATGMQTPPGGPMTGGMPPGPQQNVWQGIGAPRQLPAGSPTQGQGVVQVPPPGAANNAGATGTLNQIPPAPRTAAPPADTSFVRGMSVPSSDPTFYRMPIAQQMAKQVWDAVKPKTETPAKAPDLDDVIDATAQEMAPPAAQQPAAPPATAPEPTAPPPAPTAIPTTFFRGTESADPGTAVRRFTDGDLGDGIYVTPHRWLAETYGGGPGASVKKGTRVVHQISTGESQPNEVAYLRGGSNGQTDAHLVTGDGKELWAGKISGKKSEAQNRSDMNAAARAAGVKLILGEPDSVAINQAVVLDKNLIQNTQALTPPSTTPAPVTPAVAARAKRQAPPGSVNLEKAMGVLNEGMAKTRQAPPSAPAPKAGGLDYPKDWTPGPADKFFDFAKSKKAGEEPYVSWKENASLPPALSDAQIGEAQRFIDAANQRTPGGFQGIQDRLENVKYYQGGAGSKFPTAAGDRADAINELLHSVNPLIAKRILEAGQ